MMDRVGYLNVPSLYNDEEVVHSTEDTELKKGNEVTLNSATFM
jgi:hypothetical protein